MQTSSRQAYLDWLRIMAIIGVLFFHSAMPFVEGEWHIKNQETSPVLTEFTNWLHRFRMPLLFFISGTVSYFMMQKRTSGGFIALRFRRLFIPLLLGMLVIVPPQVYMERVSQGYRGSFWDFYPSIFTHGPYPKGNMSWHHLWFIMYLLVYDIICAPLFAWLISAKGKLFLQKLSWLAKGKRVYLLMIPGVMIFAFFAERFPETNNLVQDYAYLPYWLCFLLAGFICIAWPGLMDSLERNRRSSFTAAFATLLVLSYLRWNKQTPWDIIIPYRIDWRTYAYMAISAICAWGWVLTAVGYGKRYLNRKFRIMDYLNQAVYPFYILHQTVIVIIGYYVVRTTDVIAMKYIFTVILTFIISVSIYHLFIRPFAWARFLFGMKGAGAKEIIVREKSETVIAEPEIVAAINM
ncbi:MAG: acyltransferase family protein [Bacteroidota bacterium]|nr:acyltransferase family protein [Bacteroidota bacterium]